MLRKIAYYNFSVEVLFVTSILLDFSKLINYITVNTFTKYPVIFQFNTFTNYPVIFQFLESEM